MITSRPEVRELRYVSDETGWFQLTECPVGFNKLPSRLKIEDRQHANIQAEIIIHGPIQKGKFSFFTGLRPIYGRKYAFEGNKPGDRGANKSLILFAFSPDNQTLRVFFWNNYWLFSADQRIQFLSQFLAKRRL